jgi:XFP C-terminal domain/Family of unknown function (DUF6069)
LCFVQPPDARTRNRSASGRPCTRWWIAGFIEEGTTTTPFEMVVRNRAARYHLVIDHAVGRALGLDTGVLICQGVLDISLLRPALRLRIADSFWADYALTAFLLALVATGLAHGLALATPRPRAFFGWIIGLATVCGTAAPFAFGSDTASQVATAFINLALGICTGTLIAMVMERTVIVHRRRPVSPTR